MLCKVVLRTDDETDRYVPPDIELIIGHGLPEGKVPMGNSFWIGAHGISLRKDSCVNISQTVKAVASMGSPTGESLSKFLASLSDGFFCKM